MKNRRDASCLLLSVLPLFVYFFYTTTQTYSLSSVFSLYSRHGLTDLYHGEVNIGTAGVSGGKIKRKRQA